MAMVDCELMVGTVLIVFPECITCSSILISCFDIAFSLLLQILSACDNLCDWSYVAVLVKLLFHGLGKMDAGIGAATGVDGVDVGGT